VIAAMEAAIAAADYDPDHLAIAARANAAFPPALTRLPDELTDRVMHLPEREAPSLAGYDQLLVGVR